MKRCVLPPLRPGNKIVCGFSVNFERNLRYFKVKESTLFVEQKRNGINYQFTHTLTRLILVTFKLLKALLTCTIIP